MLVLLCTALASDIVQYELNSAVTHGKEVASVTFKPQIAGRFAFAVDCGIKRWALPPAEHQLGARVVLELTGLPKGVFDCTGAIEVLSTESGQSGTLSFRSPVASLDPLDWKATVDDVDLSAHTAVVWASRPLTTAVATLTDRGGTQFAVVEADLADPQRPVFRWDAEDEVLKVAIEATDTHGFRSRLDLSPWSYEIPHDDVVFETNQHTVRPIEVNKLEKTWAEIGDVLEQYGPYVEIELYVAGYTDTVGDGASNQALSSRRAKAIATWFRERGFTGALHYQGFGETALAVPTANGVDEERNRRALYVLSASPPRTSAAIPRSDWRTLQ